jgi:hypothetical protein
MSLERRNFIRSGNRCMMLSALRYIYVICEFIQRILGQDQIQEIETYVNNANHALLI